MLFNYATNFLVINKKITGTGILASHFTDIVEVIYFLATALLAASTISSVSK